MGVFCAVVNKNYGGEKMVRGLRTKDFKLGCLHGKLDAENKQSEAHIQRTIFLSQRLKIWRKRTDTTIVRIFAYEVPIEDYKRSRRVDLMGYDEDHNLYIIELKKKDSKDYIEKVVEQMRSCQ